MTEYTISAQPAEGPPSLIRTQDRGRALRYIAMFQALAGPDTLPAYSNLQVTADGKAVAGGNWRKDLP